MVVAGYARIDSEKMESFSPTPERGCENLKVSMTNSIAEIWDREDGQVEVRWVQPLERYPASINDEQCFETRSEAAFYARAMLESGKVCKVHDFTVPKTQAEKSAYAEGHIGIGCEPLPYEVIMHLRAAQVANIKPLTLGAYQI